MATPSPLDVYRPAQEMAKQEIGNINTFGIGSDPVLKKQYEESIEAQKKVADALAERYANPNWGRISAAMLKPQLGGFAASFGSAQEELGNYQEAERAAQPTIAQMRADVAKGMFNLAQQNKASMIAEEAGRRGYVLPHEAASIEGLTKGPTGVPKATTEQETAAINQFNTKLQAAGSVVKLKNEMGEEYVNRLLPSALAMFPNLRNLIPDLPKNIVPAGGATTKNSGDNSLALAENERKLRELAARTANEITPADKAELARLNKERAQLGGSPISANTTNVVTQPSATAATKKEATGQSWDSENYKVEPAPRQPNEPNASYLSRMQSNREQTQKDLGELSYLPQDPNFVTRRTNLVKLSELLGDKKVREFASRGSQNELSTMITAALASNTPPDAIANMVRKSNFITPMDSDADVKKFQEYIQTLAREQAVVNNLIKNPTNAKFGMEQASSIQQGTQPEAAFRTAMEELHKMQRQAVMANLLQPYANAGYSTSEAMNSKRLRDFNSEWNSIHTDIAKHANKYKLPRFLADPEAYSPNFSYRKYRKAD